MTPRRPLPLAPLLALPLAIWACAGDPDGHISAADLAARIEAGTAPPVVDVRSNGEYRAGHVPGAIHLGFLSAFGSGGELALPRDEPVVVYCEHGPRAGIARFALHRHGFERVVLLVGHMKGWRKAGLPVEVPPAAVAGKQD